RRAGGAGPRPRRAPSTAHGRAAREPRPRRARCDSGRTDRRRAGGRAPSWSPGAPAEAGEGGRRTRSMLWSPFFLSSVDRFCHPLRATGSPAAAAELGGRLPGRRGPVGEPLRELLDGDDVAVYDGLLLVSERELLLQAQDVALGRDELDEVRLAGPVEVTAGAGHAVRTLVEEFVGAQAVAEVIEPPRLPGGRLLDRVLVDEHLDRPHVALEVTRVGVGLRELRRRDRHIVLRRGGRAVPEPCLQLEERHRLARVEELARDRCARPVARDGATGVLRGDLRHPAEDGDDRLVDQLSPPSPRPVHEQEVHALAGLAIDAPRLRGTDRLPRLDGLADLLIGGLGVVGLGLVHGDVDEADAILRRRRGGLLPPHAPDAQAADLVAAQAREEPHERYGPCVLNRVDVSLH